MEQKYAKPLEWSNTCFTLGWLRLQAAQMFCFGRHYGYYSYETHLMWPQVSPHHQNEITCGINTLFFSAVGRAVYQLYPWSCFVTFPALTHSIYIPLQLPSLLPWNEDLTWTCFPLYIDVAAVRLLLLPAVAVLLSCVYVNSYSSCPCCCHCSINLRLLYQAGWPTWITIVC